MSEEHCTICDKLLDEKKNASIIAITKDGDICCFNCLANIGVQLACRLLSRAVPAARLKTEFSQNS